MARITITSTAQLRAFQAKLKILKNVMPTLQRQAVDNVANRKALEEIHQQMRQNNFSEKIIDSTFVGKTEKIGNSILRTHFISNYVDPETGFDVSKAREEGTANNVTRRPKKPDGALRIPLPDGNVIFRKSATPMGMERLLIMKKTVTKAQNEALSEIGSNLSSLYSKILGV